MMNTVCILEGNIKERKGFLSKIKKSLVDYELFVFDHDDYYDYVSQIVTEISCFGQKRLFIIKELPQIQIESKKKGTANKSQIRTKVLNNFKKLLHSIPAGNIVLFDNIGISSSPFLKEVKKYGVVKQFKQKITKFDAKRILFDRFKKTKIDFSNEVADLIIESLNPNGNDIDVDKLNLLFIKLYNYFYGKTTVSVDDVYAICSASKDFIIWTLYNILDETNSKKNNKYKRSFRLAINFLNNTRYFRYESTMLMQNMLWRYGLLMLIKDGANNKTSMQEIIDDISNIKKLKSEGKAQKIRMLPKEDKLEYSIKMINTVMQKNIILCYTLNELLSIYRVIYKSLVKIRSGCTDAEIITLLQIIFLTICGELNLDIVRDGITDCKKNLRGTA